MKKWKFSALIVLSIILLSLLFYFTSLEQIVKNIPILKGIYQNTSLEITTPNSKALIKIDGKEYGETPSNIQYLTSGEYEVELIKDSQQKNFYKPHIFNIHLTKNSTSRINMEIGPGDNLHGTLLYYTEDNIQSKSKGKITITSRTENARIYVNDEYLQDTPITNYELDSREYKIKIVSEGYEDLELPVIVRDGYILNIQGYQFPIPVTFEENITNE